MGKFTYLPFPLKRTEEIYRYQRQISLRVIKQTNETDSAFAPGVFHMKTHNPINFPLHAMISAWLSMTWMLINDLITGKWRELCVHLNKYEHCIVFACLNTFASLFFCSIVGGNMVEQSAGVYALNCSSWNDRGSDSLWGQTQRPMVVWLSSSGEQA